MRAPFRFAKRRGPDGAAAPVPETGPVEAPPIAGPARRDDEIVDVIEADLLKAITRVSGTAGAAHGEVEATRADLALVAGHLGELAASAAGASTRAGTLVGATDELAAASGSILEAMDVASRHLDDAVACARDANALIAALTRASDEIVGVIDTIASVARQTNLLALNATIEAARAGAAGRGFAVVAQEVKALSVETGRAADDVRGRVTRLRESAAASIGAVERMAAVVDGVQPVFRTVHAVASDQNGAINDLARRAAEVSTLAGAVNGLAGQVDAAASDASARMAGADAAATAAADLARGLGQRFTAVMRQNEIGDRRRHDRYPVELAVRCRGGGLDAARTVDLGEGGLLLAADGARPAVGTALDLDVERLGRVGARVVAVSPAGIHCAFEAAGAGAGIAALVAEVAAEYRPLIKVAQGAAARVAAVIEAAVAGGRLTREAAFDVEYRPVPGTAPPQFVTASVPALEAVLPDILEPLLISDNRMVFCIAVDRNGYVPVHNRRFALAQRPGEVAWNTANARNRRIFDDRAGITAARSTRPFLVQAYRRDMGGGEIVLMREVDAPIRVLGRHWGGFRTAYRL